MPLLARRAASATERTLVYFRMNMYIRPPTPLCSSPTHQNISGRRWTRAYFRDGSFLTESTGIACLLMSASLQARPKCCIAAK
jgi:hypothetical protein